MAIFNHSQIQEFRNPRKIPAGLSGCPLGHLKTKLIDLHLVELDGWDNFIQRVWDGMHLWGISSFAKNNLDEVTEKMFHFVIIEVSKLRLKLNPIIIPLIEEAWRGHPIK